MARMEFNKRIFVFAMMVAVIVGFQNCGPQLSDEANLTTGKSQSSSNQPDGSGLTTGTGSAGGSDTAMKVTGYTSAMAQSDCSKAGSTVTQMIENAPANTLVCAEFVLDMPAGHPRFNERNTCDTASKFYAPDSSWAYDSVNRVWKPKSVFVLNGQGVVVPGTYWLAAMDSQGKIHKSAPMVVARRGYDHCIPSSGSAATTCYWSGIVAGPEAQPTGTCSQANVGATAKNDRGTVFTCSCK